MIEEINGEMKNKADKTDRKKNSMWRAQDL